jgi:hypothetical protein
MVGYVCQYWRSTWENRNNLALPKQSQLVKYDKREAKNLLQQLKSGQIRVKPIENKSFSAITGEEDLFRKSGSDLDVSESSSGEEERSPVYSNEGNSKALRTERDDKLDRKLAGVQVSYDNILSRVTKPSDLVIKTAGQYLTPKKEIALTSNQGLNSSSNNAPNENKKPPETLLVQDQSVTERTERVKSDKHMQSIIDYVLSAEKKMASLSTEKKRIKKLIKAWNLTYQKQYGKLPSSTDRKGHLRELHEEYHQVSEDCIALIFHLI